MNKYNLKEFLEDKLKTHKSTFKDTSYDNANHRYLCSDENTSDVYNFDKYIEENFDKSKLPSSPDAIYIGNKQLYFIEFKHQRASSIVSQEIKSKFEKGTNILKDMLKEFTPKDNKFIFCVVFENQDRPKYFDSRHFQSNSIKFGLDELNKQLGSFYDHIITEDVNFYKDKFKHLSCK
ncbi:hypothetical protein L5F07_00910 [Aliarcobacter butzleri]|uniref:hypothetical protein n=1 Tax=Aliarcobacter butzleri TaxID=28197 RepID=UPI001EDC2F81|nr:hypothetical protein [Aliarcobacter butzleri]MCG3677806.1 hypothetical protein [Aliarcobacter butzleri]